MEGKKTNPQTKHQNFNEGYFQALSATLKCTGTSLRAEDVSGKIFKKLNKEKYIRSRPVKQQC